MSEVILVVLQRSDTAPGLLRAAERFAALASGARVNALAVTAFPALKAAYDNWLAMPRANPVSAHWHVAAADISDVIEERGGAPMSSWSPAPEPMTKARLGRHSGLPC